MLKFLVYRFVVEYLSNNHLTLKNNHLTLKSTVNTSTSSSIQLQNIPGNIRRYSFQTQQPNSGKARFNSCASFFVTQVPKSFIKLEKFSARQKMQATVKHGTFFGFFLIWLFAYWLDSNLIPIDSKKLRFWNLDYIIRFTSKNESGIAKKKVTWPAHFQEKFQNSNLFESNHYIPYSRTNLRIHQSYAKLFIFFQKPYLFLIWSRYP